MMYIQVPPAHIRNAHVMSAKFRGLNIPDNIFTIRVLVPNFHQRRCHPIYPLSVDVESVPRIGELYHWISFKGLLEEDSFDGYAKMYEG